MKQRLHIKAGDNVKVISGKDKGKEGKVLTVSAQKRTVIVEGINMISKHTKPRRAGEAGGIIKQEAPIYACKVMNVCPKCKKTTRIAYKLLENGGKARVCKHCQEILD